MSEQLHRFLTNVCTIVAGAIVLAGLAIWRG